MPELPEVETIRKDLKKNVRGKTIVSVDVFKNNSIKNSVQFFTDNLKLNKIIKIERKGKYLAFELKNKGKYLIIHLRMTGQLIYSKDNIKNKYTRIIIYFDDNSRLYFNDIRRFGYMQIINKKGKELIFKKLGSDPTDNNFTLEKFNFILKTKKSTLKSALLNQKIISGIGNIYADEICFNAKLRPDRKIDTLANKEFLALHSSIKKILNLAIKHRGTSFRNYVGANGRKGDFLKYLKVYQREKKKCVNCKTYSIVKSKIASRSTRYCKYCQK